MLVVGVFAVALLFGVMGYYLTLIAKFYRQKFRKGPPHFWMQASLILLIAGIVLGTDLFEVVPKAVSAALICLGGLAFSGLSYRLYRTMMSKS